MSEGTKQPSDKKEKLEPTVSAVFEGGIILEMYYDQKEKRTGFVLLKDGALSRVNDYPLDPQNKLVPYSPRNNLIRNRIVLLPSGPEEYDSEDALINEIQDFIHRYVDVTPLFEKIASYYALFSWVYDDFKEVPYLRFRGDYGSGKTRALHTIGSICYKPIFASGASTISPVFRMIDSFQGTLIIDEGDFRFSDEKAEVVKILNNGNVKGFPVLRSEVTSSGREFNPRAYQVFGPKIVATRGSFDDKALESRFITEVMGQRKLRDDIPINLPDAFDEEALRLRNKLLLFRFRNFGKQRADANLVDRSIEPRLNQIFVPLLSIVKDEKTREEIKEVARQSNSELVADRGLETEAQVLEIIKELVASAEQRISVKDVTKWFIDRFGEDYERKVTTRWIGKIIRKRLNLTTVKSNGVYLFPPSEFRKLKRLYEKYGIEPDQSAGSAESDEKSGIEPAEDIEKSS